MKMTMRLGALLLVAALAAACGGGSEPLGGVRVEAGLPGDSNKNDSQKDGQSGGKKKNEHADHEGSGNSGKEKEMEDPEPVPEGAIVVDVKGGKVSGVEDTVEVAVGDEVILVVSSDKPDEVHVHGYDETDDVGPKERAEIEFTADIPGVFEVELEEATQLLFELQIQ
ncbi:MAG: hypothetical protein ACR2MC_12810 [Actinomycetota bacterium]